MMRIEPHRIFGRSTPKRRGKRADGWLAMFALGLAVGFFVQTLDRNRSLKHIEALEHRVQSLEMQLPSGAGDVPSERGIPDESPFRTEEKIDSQQEGCLRCPARA